MNRGERRHDLPYPRIDAPGGLIDAHQHRDLVLIAHRVERIDGLIQAVHGAALPDPDGIAATASRNGARGIRCLLQRRQLHFVGIRKTGFLAADRAHADALLDAVRSILDDAIFQRPRLFARQLEIKIGVVDPTAHDRIHDFR